MKVLDADLAAADKKAPNRETAADSLCDEKLNAEKETGVVTLPRVKNRSVSRKNSDRSVRRKSRQSPSGKTKPVR
jgi:hypothetical protein